jgi:hypothetical protein
MAATAFPSEGAERVKRWLQDAAGNADEEQSISVTINVMQNGQCIIEP